MLEEQRHQHGAGCGHEQPGGRQSVLDAVRSSGSPLAPHIRERAEAGLDMDLSAVRVHTGPAAQRSAQDLGARAYTTGKDIVVGPEGADDETMYHELRHVDQQSKGAVAGTSNGAGVNVSSEGDPFERDAAAFGRQMARGDTPAPQKAREGQDGEAAAGHSDGITVARMPSRRRGRQMYPADVGQQFEIDYQGYEVVGRYVRSSSRGEVFDTSSFGRITVSPSDILGPRATVGGMHPPGRSRPPAENLGGRDRIYLSEGDASAARARVRRDPRMADRMAYTTYDAGGDPRYEDLPAHAEDLRRLGVPHFPNMDIRDQRAMEQLRGAEHGANIHNHMPRVPQGTRGYSTQQLVRDTARLPERLGRHDMTVSVTTPRPDFYGNPATHNRIYGLESRRALEDTRMEVTAEYSDSEGSLEDYGYSHRRTTENESTGAAERRRKYRMSGRDRDW
ncbi:eCIS core domain-containing protein [Streptomyces pinistramenti]|uniref:eCIS core domain-containing protein n=1 Tax=Streptomyces pinistramenti TaxID=2884812 RepID=UPI001D066BCF|nr:DUF4157 domain-containing protein [Streptomyces pinistramenti]MCB5911533.1 DUF4157 domain-containing protein [Streptomyces pinistramenti]